MSAGPIVLGPGHDADLRDVMRVMDSSFDPGFGEAWTIAQCAGLLPLPGVWLTLARDGEEAVGFALARLVADEAADAAREGSPFEDPSTIGPYRLLERLGQGSFGVVHRAEDTRLGRTVALKVLAHGGLGSERERAIFEREAAKLGENFLDAAAKRVAFLIARSIGRKGTPGLRPFRKAGAYIQPKLEAIFRRHLSRVIGERGKGAP